MSTSQAEAPPPHPLYHELILTPPHEEAEAVVDRLRFWNSSLKPWDLYECWLLQDVARETIRLERLHQQEIALRHEEALSAGPSWDEDRLNAAESLAANLARYPAHTLALLRRSRHGCELIARRWTTLLATLDARGVWSDRERLLALNLLNVPPDLRESITPLDAPADADPVAHVRSVATREIDRHLDLASDLAPIDAHQRETVRLGLGPDTPALAGLRKQERIASRLLAWSRSQFKTSRRDPRPTDPGDLPAYTPPARKTDADSDPDAPAERNFKSPAWSPPNPPIASPSRPDSSDPRRPPRASPNSKPRRRRA